MGDEQSSYYKVYALYGGGSAAEFFSRSFSYLSFTFYRASFQLRV